MRVELRAALGDRLGRFVICSSADALAQAKAEPDCLGLLPCATDIATACLLDSGFYVVDAAAQPAVLLTTGAAALQPTFGA